MTFRYPLYGTNRSTFWWQMTNSQQDCKLFIWYLHSCLTIGRLLAQLICCHILQMPYPSLKKVFFNTSILSITILNMNSYEMPRINYFCYIFAGDNFYIQDVITYKDRWIINLRCLREHDHMSSIALSLDKWLKIFNHKNALLYQIFYILFKLMEKT